MRGWLVLPSPFLLLGPSISSLPSTPLLPCFLPSFTSHAYHLYDVFRCEAQNDPLHCSRSSDMGLERIEWMTDRFIGPPSPSSLVFGSWPLPCPSSASCIPLVWRAHFSLRSTSQSLWLMIDSRIQPSPFLLLPSIPHLLPPPSLISLSLIDTYHLSDVFVLGCEAHHDSLHCRGLFQKDIHAIFLIVEERFQYVQTSKHTSLAVAETKKKRGRR